ncbi:DNA-binding transcriptional LysR family regulator [Arthrobacter woluwensis]|uniref:LysR family transcriptional regulator n=1 Tax=Arthrobacter woluwensis TaxID=156980 RepID=UPI00277E522B|nr:LysR family transcriptional regulator [Arthrobacter woluwensis]MDQ0710241.1 DNA-binding transcriptional LysR family regulator [Arthrobacter woluwensis]
MKLERLEYFLALAEELHFGRAATRLRLSQPALSQQIKRLESELGVMLCERDAQGVRLTEPGRRLASGGAAVLSSYEALRNEVIAIGRGASGVLRLALTRSDGDAVGRALVTEFQRLHPGVEVQTEAGWTSWNLEQLVRGDIDAALVRMPVSQQGVRVDQLGVSEIVAVLPAHHPLARRRVLNAADLAEETLIFWPRKQAPGAHDALLQELFGAGIRPVLRSEPDADNILAAVRANGGIGLLDRARVGRVRGLVTRKLTPSPHLGLGLAWRPEQSSPQRDAFLACVLPKRGSLDGPSTARRE